MKSVICFLSRQMGPELTEFINEINDKYGNAYCMNDNPPDGIDFVKDEVLRAEGFWGINRVDWIKREITAWEKALYYFCKIETEPEYVWFIEDDVFVPHIDLISEIDAKHPNADLLSKQHFSKDESPSWFCWNMQEHKLIEGPHYQSMCCAVRISRRLLMAIQEFAKEKGELIFLEFLFNTLAAKKGFKVECPKALKFIHFKEQQNHFGFNRNYMYHPIKNYKIHPLLRKTTQSPPTIHYLTIATKPHKNLNRIMDVLAVNGDTISILGLNQNSDMRGFGVKLNYIKEYLKDLDDLDILLCTDAYDIILNGTLAEIQRRFVETGVKLLFGAEIGCWPDPHRKSDYKTHSENFPYLNAGAFIGYVGVIKSILNAFNIDDAIDDQRLWTDIYLKTGIITLDHSNKIFFNMFKVDLKKVNIKGKSFKYGEADPLIIHFNGESKELFDTVWKTRLPLTI